MANEYRISQAGVEVLSSIPPDLNMRVTDQQFVTAVNKYTFDALVAGNQLYTIASQHEFDALVGNYQIITVVEEIVINERRKNFMTFSPG